MYSRSKGFTLIELMISLAIGLVIISAVLYIFLSNSTTFRMSQAQSQVQDSGRFTIEFLTREIRHDRYSPVNEFCAGGGPTNSDISVSASSEVAPFQLRFTNAWDETDLIEGGIIDSLMEAFSFEEEKNNDPIALKASDIDALDIKNSTFSSKNVVRITNQSSVHSIRQYRISNHDLSNDFFELENINSVNALQNQLKRQKDRAVILAAKDQTAMSEEEKNEDKRILALEQVLIAIEEDCIRGTVFVTTLDNSTINFEAPDKKVSFNSPSATAGIGYNYTNGNIILAEDLYNYVKDKESFTYYFIDQPPGADLPSLYRQKDDNEPEAMVTGLVDFEIEAISSAIDQGVAISFRVASDLTGFSEVDDIDNTNPDKRLQQAFMTSTIRRN